jgi:hypothetical protein
MPCIISKERIRRKRRQAFGGSVSPEGDGKSGAEGANISQGEQAEIGERLLTESSQGNEGSSFDLL